MNGLIQSGLTQPALPTVGLLSGLVLLVVAVRRLVREPAGRWAWGGLLLACLTCLGAWRWPLLRVPAVTTDEPLLLAGALAYGIDGVPFRSADLASNGPLAVCPLVFARALGLPGDEVTARLLALLFDGGSLVAAGALVRRFASARQAWPTMLVVTAFLAGGFVSPVHEYSSLHPAAFLLLCCCLLLWRPMPAVGSGAPARWLGAGCLLGLVPWTGGWGLVAAVAAWSAVALAVRLVPGRAGEMRAQVLPAGATALYTWVAGLCLVHGLGQWPRLWEGYLPWRSGGSASLAAALRWTAAGALPLPLAGAWGAVQRGRFSRWWSVASIPASLLLLATGWRAGMPGAQGGGDIDNRAVSPGDLARQIRSLARTGDRLFVWGPRPQLYAETGLPPAATAIAPASIMQWPAGGKEAAQRRLVAEIQGTKPAFMVLDKSAVETLSAGAKGDFPALFDYIQNYYQPIGRDVQSSLFMRSSRVAETRPAAVKVTMLELSQIRVLSSVGKIALLDEGRWFAHARSHFCYTVTGPARSLKGTFGFLPSAYADAGKATDGATFIIEAVTAGGLRERLLERTLNPLAEQRDRGPIAFVCELPRQPGLELEFVVNPGQGNSYDWTYWGNLRLED